MVLLELLGVALGAAAISALADNSNKKNNHKDTENKSNVSKNKKYSYNKYHNNNDGKCPNCGKIINRKALRCIYCNYSFIEHKVMPKTNGFEEVSKTSKQKKYVDSELYAELINGKNIPNMPTVQDIPRSYIENPPTESKSNKKSEINSLHIKIPGLVIGRPYSNKELMNMFKCSNAGGMRRSKRTNTLLLIYNHEGIYDDAWKGDVLHYTGMGLHGDQKLDGNQNRTLYESNTNGVDLHLFEVVQMGKYEYQGPVKLAGKPYQETQRDANGVLRKVWMFPLKKIGEVKENYSNQNDEKVLDRANYCPNCNVTYHGKEKFCRICKTKLIVRSEYNPQNNISTEQTPQTKPTTPTNNIPTGKRTQSKTDIQKSYKVSVGQNKNNPVTDDRPKGAEFTDGKTKGELQMELDFVTRKLEDCQKSGDYMMSYYKGKKEILEKALEK